MVLICAGMSSGPSVSWRPSGALGREPAQRRRQIVEHRRIGVFLDRQRCRGMTDEQRHRALLRAGLADEFCDFGGEIDEARARGLHRQQRRYDGSGADGGWRGAGERFGGRHELSLNVVPADDAQESADDHRRSMVTDDIYSHRAIERPRAWVPDERRDATRRERAARQILPLTSFCTRLAISISRLHARSRNDIMRSMSRSLGSGISILRSPSATFGSGFFSESDFGNGFVDLAGDDRLARRQLGLQFFIVGLQPADFRIQRRALVGHGIAGPARAAIAAGRNRAGPGIEPDHAVGDGRQRIAAVLGSPASIARARCRCRQGRKPAPRPQWRW